MAEERLIFTTTLTSVDGTDIDIFTFYDPSADKLPNTLLGEIPEAVGQKEGVNFVEGELVLTLKNYPDNIYYEVNAKGELIVYTPTVNDASQYSIDNPTGQLQYNTI